MYDDAGISRQAELSGLEHAMSAGFRRRPSCTRVSWEMRQRHGAAAARSRQLTTICWLGSALCLLSVLLIALQIMPAPEGTGSGALLAISAPIVLLIYRLVRITRDISLQAMLQDMRLEQLTAENSRLSQLSVTDALTGAANRRHLEHALRTLCTQPPCGDFLLLADIDFFKQFNDRHGHIAGDACLREVVAAIRGQLRRTDLVARFGGEEFAIILPRTTYADALATAERIRAGVASQSMRVDGEAEAVTVSIGLAERAGAMAPANLIALADHALYAAKHAGRNRIFSADQTPREVAA